MKNLRSSQAPRRAALAAALCLAAGCTERESPDRLWIDAIRVLDEDDGLGGALEIEVHLRTATGAYLGCASLEPVDVSSQTYDGLDAFFVRSVDSDRLEPFDLGGLDVRIEVIEDDQLPCPVAPDIAGGDDPVGTSEVIAGEDLGATGTLRFENVALLELGLRP
jgi:hypothetical protein